MIAAALMSFILLLSNAKPLIAAEGVEKIPTTTRLVKLYAELEKDIKAAQLGTDASRLDYLITQDFEQRTPQTADNPTPRNEWLAACAKDSDLIEALVITKMSVRDIGLSALVSFVLLDRKHKNKELFFVVDLWVNDKGHPQLKNRFISPTESLVPRSLCEHHSKSHSAGNKE